MKKRLVLTGILFLVLTLFMLPVPASAANTWYVSPNGHDDTGNGSLGNPWKTITHAISQATPGDTITVMDDNIDSTDDYTENITVDKSLTIERYDSDATAPWVRAKSKSTSVFNVTANNVTIKGLYIYAFDFMWPGNGIRLVGVNGCTISDNICGWDNYHLNKTGIYMESCTGNTISGNICNWSRMGSGIGLYSSNGNTISGNTCESNCYGMEVSGDNNIICGNVFGANDMNMIMGGCDNICYLNSFHISCCLMFVNVKFSGTCTSTWHSPTQLSYFLNGSHQNYLGNFYYDSTKNDPDGDGISNTVYNFPVSDDHTPQYGHEESYTLMQTSDKYTVKAWYLHSDYKMYEANMGKGPGSVTLSASGGSKIWISDYSFQGVTFPNDTWTGQIVFTTAPANSHTFTVEIGFSTNGSDFTAGGPDVTLTGDGNKTTFAYTTDAGSVSVPSGKYLALKITNNNADSYSVTTGGAWSYISPPAGEAITTTQGDADGNGNIEATDITKVERIIAGLDTPTSGADANQDGNINALDITKVGRIIAGLD